LRNELLIDLKLSDRSARNGERKRYAKSHESSRMPHGDPPNSRRPKLWRPMVMGDTGAFKVKRDPTAR
jgi:hypothetical protein